MNVPPPSVRVTVTSVGQGLDLSLAPWSRQAPSPHLDGEGSGDQGPREQKKTKLLGGEVVQGVEGEAVGRLGGHVAWQSQVWQGSVSVTQPLAMLTAGSASSWHNTRARNKNICFGKIFLKEKRHNFFLFFTRQNIYYSCDCPPGPRGSPMPPRPKPRPLPRGVEVESSLARPSLESPHTPPAQHWLLGLVFTRLRPGRFQHAVTPLAT